jgi:hypothetical protein
MKPGLSPSADETRGSGHIILGHSKGDEKALTFQFGGQSSSELPPGGEWRCLWLAKVSRVRLRDGPWRTGVRHTAPQGCVEDVDLDANAFSPYAPSAGSECVGALESKSPAETAGLFDLKV